MNGNAKNTEDDTGYGAFFIRITDFSTICKIRYAIGYHLRVKVSWGNLLTEFMGVSTIKASGIHDGMARTAIQVEDEVLDPLKGWFLWDRHMD